MICLYLLGNTPPVGEPLDKPRDAPDVQVLQGLRKHLLGAVRHEAANLVEAQYARIAPVQQKQHKQ